jgi:predicted permease
LFLAEKRTPADKSSAPSTSSHVASWALTGAKLLLQPALTWWLAARVFALSPMLVEMSVVLAALPTGTGPFMLAEFYRREAHITSRTILLSTLGSLVTLSLLLLYMPRG